MNHKDESKIFTVPSPTLETVGGDPVVLRKVHESIDRTHRIKESIPDDYVALVDVEGLDTVDVVVALWTHARPVGLGVLAEQRIISVTDLVTALSEQVSMSGRYYFDYFFGRPLKLRFNKDDKVLDCTRYDSYHGIGTAASAIAKLRASLSNQTNQPSPPTKEE